jgi:hypothetical protein
MSTLAWLFGGIGLAILLVPKISEYIISLSFIPAIISSNMLIVGIGLVTAGIAIGGK